MTDKMMEEIIVTPRSTVFQREKLVFQGLETDPAKVSVLMTNLAKAYGTLRRGMAETNPNFKQSIPYAIVRRGEEIFVYKRLAGGGEERLYDKLSIGVGGHMNMIGPSKIFTNLVNANLKRELEEELFISDANYTTKTIGIINDDSDEVNRVHIGILVVVDVAPDSTVEVRETDVLEGGFVSLDYLEQEDNYNLLENWSKHALEALRK